MNPRWPLWVGIEPGFQKWSLVKDPRVLVDMPSCHKGPSGVWGYSQIPGPSGWPGAWDAAEKKQGVTGPIP